MNRARVDQLHESHDAMNNDHSHLQSVHAYIGYCVFVGVSVRSTRVLTTHTHQCLSKKHSDPQAAGVQVFEDAAASSEVLALLYLASGRNDSVHLASDMLGLLGRAETLGLTSYHKYLSPVNSRKRVETYAELSGSVGSNLGARVSFCPPSRFSSCDTGRVALQKRIRSIIRRISFPFVLLAAAWVEAHRRWQSITNVILKSSSNSPPSQTSTVPAPAELGLGPSVRHFSVTSIVLTSYPIFYVRIVSQNGKISLSFCLRWPRVAHRWRIYLTSTPKCTVVYLRDFISSQKIAWITSSKNSFSN